MGVARTLTDLVVDTHSPNSVSSRLRRRRWATLLARFPSLAEMSVLDLGGTSWSWELCPVKPARLTLLNLRPQAEEDGVSAIAGDACDPPAELFSRHFDLVYSNSLIEHLGDDAHRRRFAEAVHALGEHHWVQTPNRGFPIEPHLLCPGLQFLPQWLAVYWARVWPVGHLANEIHTVADARRLLGSIHLMTRDEVAAYFPGSTIIDERVGPLTKSFVAYR